MMTVALENREGSQLSKSRLSNLRLSRHRGLMTAIVAFIVLFQIVSSLSAVPLGYYDISQMATSGATLAIVAMGQTVVVISGGFDLSAAATVSLINVALASLPPELGASPTMMTLIALGIGMAVGAFNGFFIAVLRLQAIVVTLSTMFILQGISLIVMDKPGGMIDAALSEVLMGDLITDWMPMSAALIIALLIFWYWLKRTKLGLAIYAIGGDFDSARSAGISTRLTQFMVYVIAGAFYGLAGLFISAQTGAGDPLVGNPMLLQMFAAVVVGGTLLGGGRGGLTGSVLGAYVLMIIVNILLVLNVSAYYSTVAESTILLLAVLSASLHRKSVLARNIRQLGVRLTARREGTLPASLGLSPRKLVLPAQSADRTRTRPASAEVGFLTRHGEIIRYALPAYICFIGVLVVTQVMLGNTLLSLNYYNSLIVLASFLAILALGQGTVILTGGLDLSVPWTIGLCGILLAGMVSGSNVALVYAIPTVLGVGLLIGFLNGFGIVALGLSPIVMTLAVNGMLQGAALVYSGGTPDGFAAPLLRDFMTSRFLGITPVVPFIFLFVAFAILLLGRTAFGRRVYAIGNSERGAELSGIPVKATTIKVYMLSGFCAALVGILLTGFSGQASLGMGDEYLLPSIAVVVVGGALITGGRGSYVGMVGGVILLTALQTLLAGTVIPTSARSILYGLVILGAIIALRDRRS
jgi:ribose transport system permease protein